MKKAIVCLILFLSAAALHAQSRFGYIRKNETQFFKGFMDSCKCTGYALGIVQHSDSTFSYEVTQQVEFGQLSNKDSVSRKCASMKFDIRHNLLFNNKDLREVSIIYSTYNYKKLFLKF